MGLRKCSKEGRESRNFHGLLKVEKNRAEVERGYRTKINVRKERMFKQNRNT